jgi:hypothetical protein
MTERDSRRSPTMPDEFDVWPVVQRKKNRDKVSDRYLAKRSRRMAESRKHNAGTETGEAWRELKQAVRELREDVDRLGNQ